MGATAAAAESIVASDVAAAVSSPDIASVAASVVVDPPKKTSWRPKKSAAAASDCSVSGASVVPSVAPSGTGGDASSGGGNSVFFSGTQARRDKDMLAAFSPAEEALPRIAAYLLEAVAPAPNSSTVAAQHAEPDLLYELDRTSQGILATLLAHQSENVEGTPVKFAEFDREITLHRHAGLAELQRHRRQFVKINGRNPPATSRAVGALFIDFLANQL